MENYNKLLLVSLIFFLLLRNSNNTKDIKVFGPGLKPVDIIMPARYFFINFKDASLTESSTEIKRRLSVSITGKYFKERDCRISVNIFDRNDKTFIIRYKVYESCINFRITIKYNGLHIGDSPYNVEGVVRQEECYCPEQNFEKWLESYECLDRNYKQIDKDLEFFPSVNFTSFRKKALKTFDRPGSMSVCNYVIVKNKIYRNCYGEHVGFKMFMDAILLSLSRKVVLPDMELLVNLGDWPLMKKSASEVFPLFSWCGSESTLDIVMPTYDLTQSSLECMGRVSLDMLSVQGNIGKQWDEKEEKAFWRGRDSCRERLKLIEIARKHPDIFNASLTNFFFFRDKEEEYGPKEKYISFFNFFDWKYQINIDGTVAAYRFPYLLAGDSVVLKQDSTYYEHFYSDLQQYHHYIPFKRDLSNLVEKITWAKNNDEEAKAISGNGRKYAEENLLPQHIFCYHAVLFREWSRRLTDRVKIRKDMEHVPQPDENDCICTEKVSESTHINDEL